MSTNEATKWLRNFSAARNDVLSQVCASVLDALDATEARAIEAEHRAEMAVKRSYFERVDL